MSFPDKVHLNFTDWLGRKGSQLGYFPQGSSMSTVLQAYAALLPWVLDAGYVASGEQTVMQVDPPLEGPYASYVDQMVLEFSTAIGLYDAVFTGPKAAAFLPDGVTVDTGNVRISDLITFLIANGTDDDENALLVYTQGYRRTVPSAADELLAASDFFVVGTSSAEFYSQDGMDVKVTT